jgi:prephenate dehydrogenase
MIEDQRIAIIGGTGKFGQHLGRLLESGNEIVITGSTVSKAERVAEGYEWESATNEEAVKDADVVIVSVPIQYTVETIEEIGPHLDNDTLLCDVTSVKQKPCEAMEKYSDQVVGMHPMYAPSNSPENQNVILCPINGKKWTMMEEFWIEHNANVSIVTPEEHDKAVSIVQGLTHFTEMVFAKTIKDFEAGETEEYETPVYQIINDLKNRMLNQHSDLYESIQKENPENTEMRQQFIDSAENVSELIEDGEVGELFEELSDGQDLEVSQRRTDELIEFLTNDLRE